MIKQKTFLVALLTLGVALVCTVAISLRGEPAVVEKNLGKLPMYIDGYTGRSDRFPASVYQVLDADENVYRHYVSAQGNRVNLYIGYYGTAKGGRTGHNPLGCLPGSGWAILQNRKAKLTTSLYPEGVAVNYILARKEGLYTTMYYWYQSAGTKVLASGVSQNLKRFFSKILFNRDDGAFVEVYSISEPDKVQKSSLLSEGFADHIVDLLPHYWPLEK